MSAAMAAFICNDALMKQITQSLPLPQAMVLRGLVALAGLLLVAAWRRPWAGLRLRGRDLHLLGWRSLAEIGSTLTYLTALAHMPLANLVAILQALPLAVALTAALVLSEPLGRRHLLVILVGFAGVLLIVRPGPQGYDLWALLGVATVGLVVLRDLSTRAMSAAVPSLVVAIAAAAVVTLAGALLSLGTGWVRPAPVTLVQIAGAGALLVVGYLSIVAAMRAGEVARIAPYRYTALVWGLGLGWFVFGEWPEPLAWAGAALIVGAGLYGYRLSGRPA
ncbi:DMT family transporter [Phaeovulum vinaykumarii]|nr:DMT family transporter [Phaeovulum vinaykumarii]